MQNKYDTIVTYIENSITKRKPEYFEILFDPKEICSEAFFAADLGNCDLRSQNEVFKFLTNMTYSQYIERRLVMASYKDLLNQAEFDKKRLMNIMGITSEGALYKKYKETFNMTPAEAFKRKIVFLYEPPLTWDIIGEKNREDFVKITENHIVLTEIEEKKDVRPYIFIGSACIILIIVLFIIGNIVIRYRIWNGEYMVFGKYSYGGITNEHYYRDGNTTVKFDFWKREGKISFHDEGKEDMHFIIDKMSKDSLVWHFAGDKNKYHYIKSDNDINAEDLNIYIGPTDNGECYQIGIKLYRKDNHDELYSQWSGRYEMWYEDNKQYHFSDEYISLVIDIDLSVVIVKKEGNVLEINYINYFDDRELHFDSAFFYEDAQCITNGNSSFDMHLDGTDINVHFVKISTDTFSLYDDVLSEE